MIFFNLIRIIRLRFPSLMSFIVFVGTCIFLPIRGNPKFVVLNLYRRAIFFNISMIIDVKWLWWLLMQCRGLSNFGFVGLGRGFFNV